MAEYIDEFQKMEEEIEAEIRHDCYNCKHSAVAANKEPCKSCWNRSKWERRKDGVECQKK